ncbi:MAG: N-acetylmuramoyl-L-alanine amidase [Bacteroidota bacterium]
MIKIFRTKIFHFDGLNGAKPFVIFTLFCILLAISGFRFTPGKTEKTWKVVVDAGHGGRDPGTIGAITKEKDVALPVALKVGEYLKKYGENVEVVFTRDRDVFIDLKKRSEIANRHNADLFVSIHANSLPKNTPASKKASIRGTEIYVMGAQNTNRALEVAKRENSVILMEEDYEKNYDFDPTSEESFILYNLTQSAYQENSLILASLIDDQLTKRAGRKSYGVKQSSLYVMWSTAMPSVLVEIGYLSNPTEEKELRNEETQSYIASGIYRAIKEYKEAFDAQN